MPEPTHAKHANLRDAAPVRDELQRLYEQDRWRLDFLAGAFGLTKVRLVAIKNGRSPYVKASTMGTIFWTTHEIERGEYTRPDGARACPTQWARYQDTCRNGHSKHPSNRVFDKHHGFDICRICRADRAREHKAVALSVRDTTSGWRLSDMTAFNDRRPNHFPLGKPGEAGSPIRGVESGGMSHAVRQTPEAAAAATDPVALGRHIFEHHDNHGVSVRFRVKDSSTGKKGDPYFLRMGVDTAAAMHDRWHREGKDHAKGHTH